MAEAVAQPLLGTRRVTVVSGGSGEVGVGRLPAEILDVVTKLPGAVEALTGVSITQVSGVGGTVGWGAQWGGGHSGVWGGAHWHRRPPLCPPIGGAAEAGLRGLS